MISRRFWSFMIAALVPVVATAAAIKAPAIRPATAPAAVAAAPDPEWPGWAGGRPVPAIRHAIIISIDGGRPDVLLRANMPSLRKLMETGCFSFWAQTIPMSITLPSHTSMLTGVSAERHGVMWNSDLPEGVVV